MKCRGFSSTTRWSLAIIVLMEIIAGNAFAAGPTESVIYRFQEGFDGGQPWGGLIADRFGNLFGTTVSGGAYGYGTVYQLTPPTTSTGSWTLTVLYAFQGGSDGGVPIFCPNCGQCG